MTKRQAIGGNSKAVERRPIRLRMAVALIAGMVMMLVVGAFGGPALAQNEDCATEAERTEAASAIIVGKVIDVRTGSSATAGNESGDDSIVVEVLGIEKGGAQNPLAVYYPGQELPNVATDAELNIFLSYELETARAESSISCGYTLYTDGDSLIAGAESGATLGETAGETITEAVRTAGLAGAAVIAATLIWRAFREFRPRLT